MGVISGIGNLGKAGFNKATNFISAHGGKKAWDFLSPHLNKVKDSMIDDGKTIASAAKWVGSKAWGATKAIGKGIMTGAEFLNDVDSTYLGGHGKKALLHVASNYVADKLGSGDLMSKDTARNIVDKIGDSVNSIIDKHAMKRSATGMPSRYGNKRPVSGEGTSIGTSFKDLANTNPYANSLHTSVSHW